jgi:hypothetical protein
MNFDPSRFTSFYHRLLLTAEFCLLFSPTFNSTSNFFYFLWPPQAEVKARCHYPGKESVNPGWKMFKYFDSNITDEVSSSHNEAPYVNYSNRQPAATFAI